MNIRKPVYLTVLGVRVRIAVKSCPHCTNGTMIYRSVGFRNVRIGHIVLGKRPGFRRNFADHVAMTSALCPGDVKPSTKHGTLNIHRYRTGALIRGLRSLVAIDDH